MERNGQVRDPGLVWLELVWKINQTQHCSNEDFDIKQVFIVAKAVFFQACKEVYNVFLLFTSCFYLYMGRQK